VKTVSRLLHLDDGEFPALRAQIEARPPRVGARTQRPPLPLGAPARAVAALAEMHAAEPTPVAPPRPFSPDLLARLAFISTAMHADYTRHLDTMAVLDEISAVLTEHPEFLTSSDCHPGPRLWLRRIAAELVPSTAKAGC
jgi:hypothetical protein